jgi:hypothetical protein
LGKTDARGETSIKKCSNFFSEGEEQHDTAGFQEGGKGKKRVDNRMPLPPTLLLSQLLLKGYLTVKRFSLRLS